MQVLVFVFAFLTAIAVLTQAQLERYKDQRLVQQAYLQVMRARDSTLRETTQQRLYDSKSASQEASAQPPRKRINLNPYVNLAVLLDPSKQSSDPGVARVVGILDRLLPLVYGEHPFFKEMLEDYPQPQEALIAAVMREGRRLEGDARIKSSRNLARIDLGDEGLQVLWYRVLKGNALASCEDRFPPLTCFVDLRPSGKKVTSIYLAASPLLLAIFEDASLVQQILEERDRLYKAIKSGEIDLEIAGDQFASTFGKGRYLPEDGSYDFHVNTRIPPR